MAGPTEKTIKRLFAASGNVCAFPGCSSPIVDSAGVVIGEICHVCARRPGGARYNISQTEAERHDFDNLILLCGSHHKVIDERSDIYTVDVLQEMKAVRSSVSGRPEMVADGVFAKLLLNDFGRITLLNCGGVIVNSPGAMQVGVVNFKAPRSNFSFVPPSGTVGADQACSRYIQYLIKRYNEFASADRSRKAKFSYGAISANVEKYFGASWRLLPIEKFDDVCVYLQGRICKTILGKLNLSKGRRAFSTYEEYLEKNS